MFETLRLLKLKDCENETNWIIQNAKNNFQKHFFNYTYIFDLFRVSQNSEKMDSVFIFLNLLGYTVYT